MKPTIEEVSLWAKECDAATASDVRAMTLEELQRFAELACEWAVREHEAAKAAELTPKIIQEACAIFFDTARNASGDNDMYAAAKFILSRVRATDKALELALDVKEILRATCLSPSCGALAQAIKNADRHADAILAQPALESTQGAGIHHTGCNYLGIEGTVCTKCGQVVKPAIQPKPEAKPVYVPFDIERFQRDGAEIVRTRDGQKLVWLVHDGPRAKLFGRSYTHLTPDNWKEDGTNKTPNDLDLVMLPPADAKCQTCGREDAGELTDEICNAAIKVWVNTYASKTQSMRAAILNADKLTGVVRVKP